MDIVEGKPVMKKAIYDQWVGEGKKSVISTHGINRYNFAGNDKHYELSGGEQWNWQLVDKNSDEVVFKKLILKEKRPGLELDPIGFVTTMPEVNAIYTDVYGPITPMQNKALVAKSEAEGRALAQEIVDKANELGMKKFLDLATERYNKSLKEMEDSKK